MFNQQLCTRVGSGCHFTWLSNSMYLYNVYKDSFCYLSNLGRAVVTVLPRCTFIVYRIGLYNHLLPFSLETLIVATVVTVFSAQTCI